MKNIANYILSNFAFITRIPINIKFEYRSDQGNVKYFPFIGIVLGWILYLFTILLLPVFHELSISTVIVFLLIFLTGGIHLDGLSDSADGLLSYRSRDQMIEIMKDSRIGAMGVIAIVAIILLKVTFIDLFYKNNFIFFVLFIPVFGRLNIVNACFFGKPFKESKMGAGFIGNMKTLEFILIQSIYSAYMLAMVFFMDLSERDIMIYSTSLLFTAFLIILFSKVCLNSITKKLDGISGDILGAMCEVGEWISLPIFLLGVQLCKKLL